MSKIVVFGWMVELAGIALWVYGYFVTGHPPMFDWHAHTPGWVAEWLPNIESEIGMVLAFGAIVPMYWPQRQ